MLTRRVAAVLLGLLVTLNGLTAGLRDAGTAQASEDMGEVTLELAVEGLEAGTISEPTFLPWMTLACTLIYEGGYASHSLYKYNAVCQQQDSVAVFRWTIPVPLGKVCQASLGLLDATVEGYTEKLQDSYLVVQAGNVYRTTVVYTPAQESGADYTLVYDANANGEAVTGMPEPNPVVASGTEMIHTFILDKEHIPQRVGYIFKCWSTFPLIEYKVITASCPRGQTITVYAFWTVDPTAETPEPVPTETPEPTPTETPEPTPTETPEPTPTATPEPVPTETPEPTPTETPKPTPTATPEPEPTETPEPTPTETPEPTPTETPEPTPTETPEPVPTETPEPVPTETPEPTPTETPKPTPTETPKPTPTETPEPTPTETPEPTPTETPEPTPTETPEPTPTETPEPTPTATPEPTPEVIELPGPETLRRFIQGVQVSCTTGDSGHESWIYPLREGTYSFSPVSGDENGDGYTRLTVELSSYIDSYTDATRQVHSAAGSLTAEFSLKYDRAMERWTILRSFPWGGGMYGDYSGLTAQAATVCEPVATPEPTPTATPEPTPTATPEPTPTASPEPTPAATAAPSPAPTAAPPPAPDRGPGPGSSAGTGGAAALPVMPAAEASPEPTAAPTAEPTAAPSPEPAAAPPPEEAEIAGDETPAPPARKGRAGAYLATASLGVASGGGLLWLLTRKRYRVG